MKFQKLGVIFDVGGFTGAIGAGFAKAMAEKDLKPLYVQGVSVGALNAAGVVAAGGDASAILQTWTESVEKKGPTSIFDFKSVETWSNMIRFRPYMLSNFGIQKLIEHMDFEKIVCSPIRLEIIVFNEATREQEIFSNHDLEIQENPQILRRAVLASTAIPGVFPPIPITRKSATGEMRTFQYSDGDSIQINRALAFGCDKVFVFLNDPLEHASIENSSWFVRIMNDKHFQYDIVMARELEYYKDNPNVVLFRLNERPATLLTERFAKGDISRIIESASQVGARIIERILNS